MKNKLQGQVQIALILILIFMSACKHDPIPLSDCEPLGDPQWDWNFNIVPGYAEKPEFNPSNPNELVCVVDSRLKIVNLQNSTIEIILEENIFGNLSWGPNGKIIFTRPDYNIWQINSDGTGLEQLTTQGWRFGANWNIDGTKFIAGTQDNGHYFRIIHSSTGEILDTTAVNYGCWRHDSLICYRGKVSNPYTEISDIIVPFDGSFGLGACWLNDREFIWSTEKGIFITDRISRKTETIVSSCNAITYQSPTYHHVSNKVIWQKVTKTPKSKNSSTLVVNSRLVIMNPDGTQEEELDIPY